MWCSRSYCKRAAIDLLDALRFLRAPQAWAEVSGRRATMRDASNKGYNSLQNVNGNEVLCVGGGLVGSGCIARALYLRWRYCNRAAIGLANCF